VSSLRVAGKAWLLSCVCVAGQARAAGPSLEQCVAANESAQDAERAGKLRDARARLTTCIAAECPAVLRKDCTQRLDGISRTMPTVVFVVTDAAGNDLADVRVRADDAVLTERLGGTAIEIDPGQHVLVFDAPGFGRVERSILLRVNENERVVKVVMAPVLPIAPPAPQVTPPTAPQPIPQPERSPQAAAADRSPWAYVSFGVAGAGLATGAVLTGLWGKAKGDGNAACGVPMSCDPTTANGWEGKQRGLSIGAYTSFGLAVAAASLGAYLWLGHASMAPPAGSALWLGLTRGLELDF
jgi:hypothetical protein